LYSTYDLLGRRMTGHPLKTGTVMNVTFISYAFNLNLGSFIGGGGARYRLYSRLGLPPATITRVWAFSMLTNWIGYLVMGGAAFAFWPMALPPEWKIDSEGLRWLGAAMLLVGAAYLVVCVVADEHTWSFRGRELQTPSWRMALVQMALSSANWSLMGATIWLLLQQQADYPHALAVLLVAAIAGVIIHIPAGLGVLEGVFVALLAYEIPQGQILAALLAYRALYYLLPLIAATLSFAATELRARKSRNKGNVAVQQK
ncbi:MAG: flippase-like domain-containing protein, partial [Gammaproteobacteria bacterium]|nr:flippase-like domain-containing protein [Gammaproteobacteria bacterium]